MQHPWNSGCGLPWFPLVSQPYLQHAKENVRKTLARGWDLKCHVPLTCHKQEEENLLQIAPRGTFWKRPQMLRWPCLYFWKTVYGRCCDRSTSKISENSWHKQQVSFEVLGWASHNVGGNPERSHGPRVAALRVPEPQPEARTVAGFPLERRAPCVVAGRGTGMPLPPRRSVTASSHRRILGFHSFLMCIGVPSASYNALGG